MVSVAGGPSTGGMRCASVASTPRLFTTIDAHRRLHKVTVKFEYEEDYVPAL